MSYLQTIDLDTNETTRYLNTLLRLKFCAHRCIGSFKVEHSVSTNGWHFIYRCKYDTCMCRFTLDDQNRFHKDEARPPASRNVLFDKKEAWVKTRLGMRLTK